MQMSLSQWVKQSTLGQIDWMLQQCLFIRWREGSEGQAMVFIYFWNQRGKPWYFYISETRGTSHGQIDWMLQQCLFIRWREREERTCKKRPWATFTRHCSFLSAQSQKSKKMLPKKLDCENAAMFQKYYVEHRNSLGKPDQKWLILNSKPEAFKYSGKEVRRQASSQKKIKLTLFAQGLLPAFQGVQNNWNWISVSKTLRKWLWCWCDKLNLIN